MVCNHCPVMIKSFKLCWLLATSLQKIEKEQGAHLFLSAVRSHSLFCVMLTVLGVECTEVEKQIESLPRVDMVHSV